MLVVARCCNFHSVHARFSAAGQHNRLNEFIIVGICFCFVRIRLGLVGYRLDPPGAMSGDLIANVNYNDGSLPMEQ